MKIEQEQTQRGFTLIEILTVLFICSLTVLTGLHHWQQQIEQQRIMDAVRQVSEFIYSHMKEGIYLNRHQVLSVKIGKLDWWISIKDAKTNKELGKVTADKFQGIEIAKATRTSVELYGKQGTSRAFSLELKNKNKSIFMYMSALGRVRACSYQSMAGIPKC